MEETLKSILIDLKKLKETIENQQKVIDTLSIRSIYQESEIREIKRLLKNQ